MTLGSLFDGIGGWLLAAKHSNVQPIWSSEIEKFPCAVTKKHFPEVIQLGDINQIDGGKIPAVDVICAGSPCQDLSIAGRREGITGERSGLFFRAVDVVRQMRFATSGQFPKYFIWENVTGVFSSNGGNDFRAVLEEIAETEIPMPDSRKWANAGMVRDGKCEIAWRVLDAQYFGVPQRRKRIFLVADFTKKRAAKILFESKSVSGNFAESNGERKNFADGVKKCSAYSIFDMTHADEVLRPVQGNKTNCLNARMGTGGNQVPVLAYGIGRDAFNQGSNGQFGLSITEELQPPLTAKGPGGCFDKKFIRRLTPLECERLQGLPDDWTLIDDKICSDSARYKAIGNGMAQPCADWILKRISEMTQNDRR